MSLGLVSPLLNRGVRSRWLASLPGAGSKMLTIDSNGDTAFQDIPSASWGSITGTLSSQTDLQNALNAKLSLSGGTMTGAGSAGTSTLRINAGSGSSFTQINDNGTVVIDSDTATGTFPLTLKYAGTTVASVSYQGTITGAIGAFSSLSLDSGFVILDTDATNVLAQRSSTAAQAYRIYNTFTNASNYERGQLAWESNEFRIGSAAAGTGTQRNTALGQWDGSGVWSQCFVVSSQYKNISIGFGAGPGASVYTENISIGSNTLNLGGSIGAGIVAIGNASLRYANVTNSSDGAVSIGSGAGNNLRAATTTVLVGANAGRGSSNFNARLNRTTVVGYEAGLGFDGTLSADNTVFGYRSGYSISSGNQNTFIGSQAGDAVTTGSNNIAIGYNIDVDSATASNQINIGDVYFHDRIAGAKTFSGQLTNALGTITASTPLTLTQTWNNAAVTFTGALVNVTDTASNASSLLMDLQVGGSSKARIDKNGVFANSVGINSAIIDSVSSFGTARIANSSGSISIYASAAGLSNGAAVQIHWLGAFGVPVSGFYGWLPGSDLTAQADTRIFRDASGILGQRNGVNAQTFRVYNTYTDASNYERGKIEWSSNVLRIGTEKAGTGSARALELQTDGTTRLTIEATSGLTVINKVQLGTGGSNGNYAASINGKVLLRSSLGNGVNIGYIGDYSYWTGVGTSQNLTYASYQAETHFFTNSQYVDGEQALILKSSEVVLGKNTTCNGNLTLSTKNIVTDTTTGTKIGTATTQKIGFWNATPVVQPAAVADATDAASVITQLNLLLSRMRDLGLIAT